MKIEHYTVAPIVQNTWCNHCFLTMIVFIATLDIISYILLLNVKFVIWLEVMGVPIQG